MDKEISSSAKYYLILKRIVGRESGGRYSIFRHGQWEPDTEWMIIHIRLRIFMQMDLIL